MSTKIKVMSVFGTRPEAIKMAPLVKALEANSKTESIVCVTAQHREMLDQVLTAFDIKPNYDLNIMEPKQTLSTITSKAMCGIEQAVLDARPHIVLVHGDTTTTFASALGAFYCKADVGHVEAGLRSFDKYSPYPEEMNRMLTSKIAKLHFAPTEANRVNLEKEGVCENVFITGNTAIDALGYTVRADYTFECSDLNHIDYKKKVVLVTAHRRENYGDAFVSMMAGIKKMAQAHPDIQVVYPVHLSPYVQEMAAAGLGNVANVSLVEPLGVFDMHNLISRSFFVLTDSGGLQEEAPSLGKPVLVMRRETERPEAVAAGTAKIVGVCAEDIYNQASILLTDPEAYKKMANAVNPYGDGKASQKIVQHIISAYEKA